MTEVRLKEQESAIRQHVLSRFQPLLNRSSDRSKGQVLPLLCHRSPMEVIAAQNFLMAEMVLLAEAPPLGCVYREAPQVHRDVVWVLTGRRRETREGAPGRPAEAGVRSIILDICGIADCHPQCPPALANAAMGLQLYGDYFVDPVERQALRLVVE